MEKVIEKQRREAAKLEVVERKQAIADIKKLEAELPDVPVKPILLVDDVTPEELARLMKLHGERQSYIDSEADALFGMMQGRYSDSPKLDLYLRAWDAEFVRINRRSGEPVELCRPLITLGIAPQPELLRGLIKTPTSD